MSDEISQNGLRRQLDRLYEQEREERAERRGLEQRAATTVAASLVALGIVLNALGSTDFDVTSGEGVLVMIGAALTLIGLFGQAFSLTGVHTNEQLSLRKAMGLGRRPRELALEPHPLTDEYVEHQRQDVQRLSKANVLVIPLMRLSSLLLGTGVYAALFGLGWHLLSRG
jgi:hypothetical protein